MPKPWIIAALLGVVPLFAQAQDKNFWQILGEVNFYARPDAAGVITEVPVFSNTLRAWDGKKIRLKGYVIPVNEVGDMDKFMFSSLPFNVCYFCGAAGPETVVEVEAAHDMRSGTRAIWIEGTLDLNATDPDHHMFIIRDAELMTLPPG